MYSIVRVVPWWKFWIIGHWAVCYDGNTSLVFAGFTRNGAANFAFTLNTR